MVLNLNMKTTKIYTFLQNQIEYDYYNFRLGSDPKLFTFELMQEHFRKFGKLGLVLSTVLLPMITSEEGSGLDLDGIGDSKATNDDGPDSNNFISHGSHIKLMERLRDVIIDMVRLGYI